MYDVSGARLRRAGGLGPRTGARAGPRSSPAPRPAQPPCPPAEPCRRRLRSCLRQDQTIKASVQVVPVHVIEPWPLLWMGHRSDRQDAPLSDLRARQISFTASADYDAHEGRLMSGEARTCGEPRSRRRQLELDAVHVDEQSGCGHVKERSFVRSLRRWHCNLVWRLCGSCIAGCSLRGKGNRSEALQMMLLRGFYLKLDGTVSNRARRQGPAAAGVRCAGIVTDCGSESMRACNACTSLFSAWNCVSCSAYWSSIELSHASQSSLCRAHVAKLSGCHQLLSRLAIHDEVDVFG